MKVIVIIFIFFSFAFSSYEKVKIGKIDNYYKDKITKNELLEMIKEIEKTFESQLGFNVFVVKVSEMMRSHWLSAKMKRYHWLTDRCCHLLIGPERAETSPSLASKELPNSPVSS